MARHVHAAGLVSIVASFLLLTLSATLPGNAAHAAVVCPNATIENGLYTIYETPQPSCSLGSGDTFLAFRDTGNAMTTWLWQGGSLPGSDYATTASLSGANCSLIGNLVYGQIGATCTVVWTWGTGNTATMTFTVNAGSPSNSATVTSLILTGGAFGGPLQQPTITSISPSQGPAAGGTPVTITGTDFIGATKVSFGSTDVSAANFTSLSDTQIVVNAPARSGTVNVSVTTAGGTTTDPGTANDFTYIAPPHITAIWSPTSIPANGAATSQLLLTLNNLNSSPLTQVSIANSVLPAGLQIQSAPVTTCGGVTLGMVGGTSFGLANGTLAPHGTCQVALDVVANVATTSTFVSGVSSALESGAGGSGATNIPLTSTALASTVEVLSGSGQSATVNTAFANPLVAIVRDFQGNPMAGITVDFTPPSSGASATLSPPSAVTDSNGRVSVTATANGTAGSNYLVHATVSGLPLPAPFNLSNGKSSQTITFTSTPPANAAIGGTPYTVTADASSGLPVTFSIDPASSAVCAISGNTVSFTGPGSCVILADQPGNGVYGPAPTATQTAISVSDTASQQATAVGEHLSQRANLIVSFQFDAGRQIDRLLQAGQQGGGSGGQFTDGQTATPLASAASPSRLSGPGAANLASAGASDLFGLKAAIESYLMAGASGNFSRVQYAGPATINADFASGFDGSFSTSLSQIMDWQQKQDAALGWGDGSASAAMPFDLWAEGTYASFDGNSDGHFGLLTLGADYIVNPQFLAGVYAQFDSTRQTSAADIDGNGWMAGAYATARLGENVFWQGRAAWGQSSNDIDTTITTGAFDTTRWLIHSELSGRWDVGNGLMISPTASFTHFEENADSYVDSLGATVPDVTARLSQLKLAPRIAYGFATGNGTWIEPSLSPELLWNFASTQAQGIGSLGGTATGPDGLRGRIKAGLKVTTPTGVSLAAEGSYDGIGASGDYQAIAGQIGLLVPF
jgi:hypothetical protein